jgi:hypothetical protein
MSIVTPSVSFLSFEVVDRKSGASDVVVSEISILKESPVSRIPGPQEIEPALQGGQTTP